MAGSDFVLIFVFILIGLAVVGVALFLAAKRRKELAAVAATLGLAFDADPPFDRGLRSFDAMNEGSNPRIRNQIAGAYKERAVRCFDFEYTVQQGKERVTKRRGVVLADVRALAHDLRIVPEHFGHKIVDALGAEEIDFEWQEFSDKFWVTSSNRKFAYDVIDARMMEFLMDAKLKRWEIRSGLLCAWRESTWAPAEVPRVLDALVAFIERVPRHVWEARA